MKIKHSISILFMILLLASCKDGLTIFDQIDQETKLEDAVITGSVNSIVKSGNTLYASDGNIYAKSVNAVRDWSKIASPGGTINKLAADSTNIYALNADGVLYTSTNGSAWNTINTSSTGTIETIFWDGASAPTAYVKATSGSFYKLAGSATPTTASDIISDVLLKTDKGTYTAKGGAVTGSNDLGSVDVDATVYSLTYSEAENALYAGTSSGLKKIILDEKGELTGETADPPGNWGATIKNYEAFAVLATGKTPNDFALYSSTIKGGTTYAKVNGLWGYYNRRNNWNRE